MPKEPIEVTARFGVDGEISPRSFIYRGEKYPVDSTGRRWQDEEGIHILVMVHGNRVFELIYHPEENLWYLGELGISRSVA